mgnify:CR=1 FL=1
MYKREIYWILGTLCSVLILIYSIFGVDGLQNDAVTTINSYDTYYVIANIHLICALVTFIFFVVYLIRMLHNNFKNATVNSIFMISDIVLIVIFTFLISWVNSISSISTTSYSPSAGAIDENTGNLWYTFECSLISTQLLLIILLAVSSMKTGLHRNKRNKNTRPNQG